MTEESRLRWALLTRTLFEVVRDADCPLQARDAVAGVRARLDLNHREASLNNSGVPRFETYIRWVSSWASTIGWMAKRGGWSITEAGIEAMDRFEGNQLDKEIGRRYRGHRKDTLDRSASYTDARWAKVSEALNLLEPGWWTTYGDLAELAGLPPQGVGTFLAQEDVPNAHRVLRGDGTISPGFRWSDPSRTDDPLHMLRHEGVEFDASDHASASQRMTVEDLRERIAELDEESESPVRRAWLVRGSSVDGRDLVPAWLARNSVSLAAANLRPITPPLLRAELKSIVDEDYSHRNYAAREAKVAEFDAFCNRMRPGDFVLTTSQGKSYLGQIDGEATYVASNDKRSNLRRATTWLNATRPVPFNELPDPLPAKLGSQSDVVELTEDMAAIETLRAMTDGGALPPETDVRRKLRFPEVSAELAERLLVDRTWLQRQADLLWDRRQLILYGPPGTGKTFLAQHLAMELAEPSAVKLVQFHPSYTYEDFFEGFRPVLGKDGTLTFDLRKGPFRTLVEDAREHPADPYLLIIDEINRANLAKVFGELYFLLEYRDKSVSLMYSAEEEFILPPNVFLIGTMNTTDRSIALVDAAIRRRFAFVELHPSTPPIADLLTTWLHRRTDAEFNRDTPELLRALNARIEDRDLAVGPSFFMLPEIYRREDGLERVWETSIMPLMAEYHYGSPPEVLHQFRLDTLRKSLASGSGEGTSP